MNPGLKLLLNLTILAIFTSCSGESPQVLLDAIDSPSDSREQTDVPAVQQDIADVPPVGTDAADDLAVQSDLADVPVCEPDCEGRECGTDGCGGQCGECNADTELCGATGLCVPLTCKSSLDCPGLLICDKESGTCVVCLVDGDCPEGHVCGADHACSEVVACQSDKECKDLDMVCDKINGFCVDCMGPAECLPEEYCLAGACTPDQCPAGEKQCHEAAVERCADDGSAWQVEETCGADQHCAEASCVDNVCPPGETYCDGDVVKVCDEVGAEVVEETDCAADDMICLEGECLDTVCPLGEAFCVDDFTMAQCAADGLTFEATPCGEAEFCEAGACQPQVCTPEATFCSDNAVKVCNLTGSAVASSTDCGQLVCENGECLNIVCEPDTTYCEDNQVKVCDETGTEPVVLEDCGEGYYCEVTNNAGQCKEQVCSPGTFACIGNTVVQCNPLGSKWLPGSVCNDGNPCTDDTCNPTIASCEFKFNSLPCNDDNVCTANDVCSGGVCAGATVTCNDSNTCTMDQCNPLTGCFYPNEDDGTGCNDGNVCTANDQCELGVCGGEWIQDCCLQHAHCDDGNPCTSDACDFGNSTCVYTENSLPCDDGNLCTAFDWCSKGSCIGLPVVCDDNDACTTDQCLPESGCDHQPILEGDSCDDLNGCTTGDICLAGVCDGVWTAGCCNTADDCEDNDDCTIDDCVDGQCLNTNTCCFSNEECDDGDDLCTTDTCVDGDCIYTPTSAPGCCLAPLFQDDFSTDKGWQLGIQWELGPADASSGQSYGKGDPAYDHTGSPDNGIIGVVIGGNASKTVHNYYWATSPTVDAAGASNLHLQFWRWLNSDYAPYMTNAVDVYDGSVWKRIYESGASPGVSDASWTFLDYDITAYKNSQLRVRFGFKIGSSGVFTVSSWNVDDVVLLDIPQDAPHLCCAYTSDCLGYHGNSAQCQSGTCVSP